VALASEEVLREIEKKHETGISSADILEVLERLEVRFSEATLRKYVQLGLLPRSVRVGRKGKHKGSQGLYPVQVIRQILRIREMMADNYTIEEIQRDILFVRGDIEELERSIDKVFEVLRGAAEPKRAEAVGRAIVSDVHSAEALARDLVQRLNAIEARLLSQARLAKNALAVGT
jgi:DNA-binding transcriptional MerR regulator